MSWLGHTLFPTVEAVFGGVKALPADPKVAGATIRKAGFPSEASYIEGLSVTDLVSVYDYSGVLNDDGEYDYDTAYACK